MAAREGDDESDVSALWPGRTEAAEDDEEEDESVFLDLNRRRSNMAQQVKTDVDGEQSAGGCENSRQSRAQECAVAEVEREKAMQNERRERSTEAEASNGKQCNTENKQRKGIKRATGALLTT